MQCPANLTFCFANEACESVVAKVRPISFQLSDYVFEIKGEEYLNKARGNKCYFVVHKNPSDSNFIFLGDTFLHHFFSVFDFDLDEVGLGVNVHSENKVRMYPPGQRDAVQSLAEQ